MNNKNPELKISVPLNRLKLETIEKVAKMKPIVKRKSTTTSVETDVHLLLNLSNTVGAGNTTEIEEPPKNKSKTDKLEDFEIIDLATEEPDKEIDLKHQKENCIIKPSLPIPGPVESEKEDKSPNEKREIYAVSKEDYELLVLIKSKGKTSKLLEAVKASESESPINIDNNNNNETDILTETVVELEDNEGNINLDAIINHSQNYKAMIFNTTSFYQNKARIRIFISNLIEEIVNKTNEYEDNIIFMLDKETQICSDFLQDSKEKSVEKSTEMHGEIHDKNGIESLEARQSVNKMPTQGNESMMKTMKMHQMPTSPVPGSLPNDQQLQKKLHHSANYPNMKMMSALENVHTMNKSWHMFYGAEGAGTGSLQGHPTQNRAATASNPARPATAFTPNHFSGSNNQVSMAAQQKRDSNSLTATATSNVAQPAFFNTCFNASFENLAKYAPAVMRNVPAAVTQYVPTAGSSGQMEMVSAQQQCTGYQTPIQKRERNTATGLPQLSLPSPVQGTEFLTGQQRWRAYLPQQRQWQAPPPNYHNNNAWHQ